MVLQGFSLEVKEGETMVILGYSGSGKSLAIKHIVGLLTPDRGSVQVDSQPGHTEFAVRLPLADQTRPSHGGRGPDMIASA